MLAPRTQILVGVAALIDSLDRVPSITDYEHARREQPSWPHPSSLCRGYGSWLGAVTAAVKVATDKPRGAPSGPRPARRTYRREDCVQAILLCKLAIGDWPSAGEYQRWRVIEAHLRRRTGETDRTPPTETVVRARLGDWPAALDLARRLWDPESRGQDDRTARIL